MVTYVKPEELLLGKRRRVVKGVIKTISDFGYIVPFKKNLENLLNMPEMFNFIKTPHKSPDDFVHDVCDGEYIQGNTLFNDHPSAIQIALSTEIVNPLGTNIKKHKISLYYFSILNIPPQFRSRINSIQLLAIAKSKLVKFHGATKLLLNDFISTVNQMSTSGLRLIINREERVIFGTLVLVSADTLAAHELGQFKEGVAFALKCCRHCNIETEFLRTTITESECHLRDTITHRDRFKVFTFQNKFQIIYKLSLKLGIPKIERISERLNKLLAAIEKIMKRSAVEDDPWRFFHAIRFIEDEIKNGKSESLIRVTTEYNENEIEKHLQTKENQPLFLQIFTSSDKIEGMYLCGDRSIIETGVKGGVLGAIFKLMAAYYIFDINYPKKYAMLMAIIQAVVFEEPFSKTTNKFKFLLKQIEKQMSSMSD
ncbi:hypothetical protein LOTGIDRAFT_176278 [Lottia gigantea]|uniref:Uncharacterized protein n=1 Tax=Lottia gigantea TaxID=225164 RepID=V3ZJH5_LOTGI|nr:hypothetical protein LOTGIDRAFT_176278 [Lottia gigantea]ESO82520.1 hypothetical protein LOTGIDRAFT_176278 [Lottia gigantea]